ncbi:MAG: hypothetical protein LV477_12670, partial [Candidatus Nitrosotalea sp.]|nr:hypothetical protein [Candidatus Nitrosotalea sp.]
MKPINYLIVTLSIIMITYFQINLVNADSITISFDSKTYKIGDTVTITLTDPDLNVNNGLVDIYTAVTPVYAVAGTPDNTVQDNATDTIGKSGLGQYSDGSAFGRLVDVQFGQQNVRWSNSKINSQFTPDNTGSCFTSESNTATTGGFASSLSATGFSLVETGSSTGIFTGTFEVPDQLCKSGTIISSVGQNIKTSYYFRDESGKLVEVSDTAGIRGKPSGLQQVFMSTDKYVYMPGDVVSIKGNSYLNDIDAKISLEKNGKIPVITKDVPINKNGTFYANFTIPFDTTARSWWLATTVGGGTLSQDISFKSESIPPLDQFWSGISHNDTLCKPNLTLIFKTIGGSPACVKPDTAYILIHRGWAKEVSQTSLYTMPTISSAPCDIPYPQSNTGVAVLYMSPNSTGKICATY